MAKKKEENILSPLMQRLIEHAHQVLKGKIWKTPLEFSPKLTELLGKPVYLKLECLQVTGSFKVRGGFYYLATLNGNERKRGIATCSSGNHGLGMAYAAKQLQIPCLIFVPKSVDPAKLAKLAELGAQVKKSEFIGYDDTMRWAAHEAKRLKIPLISAFDDEKIMASNGGTLAIEVLEQMPHATHFIMPMGGGGLAGGFSWYVKENMPNAKIIICQHAKCSNFKLSLEKGRAITYMPPIETLAGGIEGGIGSKCFDVLKNRVDEVALIKEDELKNAIFWFLQNHQYLIEPASAASLAACLYGHIKLNGPAVVILTGRNVDYSMIQQIGDLSPVSV